MRIMSASKLDAVYRSILITKFFTKGWGKPENLRRLFEFRKVVSNREECLKLVERDYPVTITKEQTLSDCRLLEGYFVTPLERYLPGIVPEVAKKAHFQAILPLNWPDTKCKPMCLHLAGTGDHYFWRRRNLMVKPLLKEAGIGGIILENPFYGLRKPTDQVRSSLHNVSDIFVMGGCLILESLVLFHWCERNGLGPLGVTGLSMGGHMASLAATNWPKPLVLVPCLSWSTASAVFLQGVMSQSINWDLLEDQYLSDGIYREKLSKMVTIVDEAFLAGKKFARTFSRTMERTDREIINKGEQVDITYKEIKKDRDSLNRQNSSTDNGEAPSNVGMQIKVSITQTGAGKDNIVNKEAIDSRGAVANGHKDATDNVQLDTFVDEMRKLLDNGKLSETLYEKLTSNEKFELEARDIEEVNNLSEESINKKVALKFKIGHIKFSPTKIIVNDTKTSDAKESVDLTTDARTKTEDIQRNESVQSDKIFIQSDKHNVQSDKVDVQSDKVEVQSDKVEVQSDKVEVQSDKVEVQSDKVEVQSDKVDCQSKKETEKKKSWNVADLTSDLWTNIPFIRSRPERKININKIHWRDREALQFMRGIMDECTHLSNFSVPYDTSLIIAVCAKHDAYVPREDVGQLEEIWPGSEVRYIDAGHVSAYLLHQSLFRACIIEAFERSSKRWRDGKHD